MLFIIVVVNTDKQTKITFLVAVFFGWYFPENIFVISFCDSEIFGFLAEAHEYQPKPWSIPLQGAKQDLLENCARYVKFPVLQVYTVASMYCCTFFSIHMKNDSLRPKWWTLTGKIWDLGEWKWTSIFMINEPEIVCLLCFVTSFLYA